MKKGFTLKSRGFTLIELLVVVLIIGILSAVALPQYQKSVEKARATEAFIMLKNLTDAANRYYLETGEYTGFSQDTMDISLPPNNGKYFNFTMDAIYSANQMDLRAFSRTKPYALVSGVMNGKKIAFYCLPSAQEGIDYCKMLGATDCAAVNTMCGISI